MISHEENIGKLMLEYEVDCCLKGLRGPLPNTPPLATKKSVSYVKETLKVLKAMYGAVTEPLIRETCGPIREEMVRKYLHYAKEMENEDLSSV
jgi:hypothetical protein